VSPPSSGAFQDDFLDTEVRAFVLDLALIASIDAAHELRITIDHDDASDHVASDHVASDHVASDHVELAVSPAALAVPEPGTVPLVAGGLLALAGLGVADGRDRAPLGTTPAPTSRNFKSRRARAMSVQSLPELLIHDLGDILFAERTILKALPKMIREVSGAEMRARLEQHLGETQQQVRNLEQAFEAVGERPKAQKCPGILGIIKEHDEFKEEEEPSKPIMEAFDLGAGLRVEHYEIAAYRSAIAVAQNLGLQQVVGLLQQNLDQELAMAAFIESAAPMALETARANAQAVAAKKGASKRGAAKRGAAKRGAVKRGAVKRGAAKGGAAKRGAAKGGAAKKGAVKRGAVKRGAAKRGATKGGARRAAGR
jgi:ferritin-like metal-binding protein YciE